MYLFTSTELVWAVEHYFIHISGHACTCLHIQKLYGQLNTILYMLVAIHALTYKYRGCMDSHGYTVMNVSKYDQSSNVASISP